jgi:hypothetical protein
MRRLGRGTAIGLLALALVLAVRPETAVPREPPPRDDAERGRTLQEQERQIRTARRVTRRILRDRRASAEVKRQASELDTLLDQRAQTIKRLEAMHRDFLAQHRADVDQLAELRRRAFEIDERLRAARAALLAANEDAIAEFHQGARRVQDLIQELGATYSRDQRERRRRRPPE